MIPQDLQELFNDLKRELTAVRTDLIIMKYSLEQIETKIDALENKSPTDPFANRTMHKL